MRGGVYDVSEQDMRRLDRFEGNYQRLEVHVFNEDGESFEAITYSNSGQSEEGKPSQEYLSVIQQGYKDWRLI